jgi:hypothetical protein
MRITIEELNGSGIFDLGGLYKTAAHRTKDEPIANQWLRNWVSGMRIRVFTFRSTQMTNGQKRDCEKFLSGQSARSGSSGRGELPKGPAI